MAWRVRWRIGFVSGMLAVVRQAEFSKSPLVLQDGRVSASVAGTAAAPPQVFACSRNEGWLS